MNHGWWGVLIVFLKPTLLLRRRPDDVTPCLERGAVRQEHVVRSLNKASNKVSGG